MSRDKSKPSRPQVRVRPLDIVRTPKGAIAVVTEGTADNFSIDFLPHQKTTYEKNECGCSDDMSVQCKEHAKATMQGLADDLDCTVAELVEYAFDSVGAPNDK